MGKTSVPAVRTQLNLDTEAIALLVSAMENSKGKSNMVVVNTVVCIAVEVMMFDARPPHRIFV